MESISGNKDSSVISKMSWKAGKNFSILHIHKPKNGPETTNQTHCCLGQQRIKMDQEAFQQIAQTISIGTGYL